MSLYWECQAQLRVRLIYVVSRSCKHPIPVYFFQAISIAPLQLLLRGAPNTARILCRSFTTERHRKLWVKLLPKVPTWRLKRNSNARPFGRIHQWATTLHVCYRTVVIIPMNLPQLSIYYCVVIGFRWTPRCVVGFSWTSSATMMNVRRRIVQGIVRLSSESPASLATYGICATFVNVIVAGNLNTWERHKLPAHQILLRLDNGNSDVIIIVM